MNSESDFLTCQVRAVTEFAISHHNEEGMRKLVDEFLASCARLEHAIARRKLHGGDAA